MAGSKEEGFVIMKACKECMNVAIDFTQSEGSLPVPQVGHWFLTSSPKGDSVWLPTGQDERIAGGC